MKLIWLVLSLGQLLAYSQVSAQDDKACFIGSSNQSYYVKSFKKSLDENTSPLVREYKYKKERVKNFQRIRDSKFKPFLNSDSAVILSIPLGVHKVAQFSEGKAFYSDKNWVTQDEIRCALMNVPYIDTQKALCDSSHTTPTYTEITPCVTDEMVEFIHFVTNKAFKCFGNKMDSYTKEVLLKKINLESAFGFFFANNKGRGISQFVAISAYEMSSNQETGHKYLMNQLSKNPQDCSAFTEILKVNPNPSSYKMNTCGYVNLQDGVGRSLIQGMGLYFYYRDTSAHSAKKLLSWLGLKPSSHRSYQEKLKILTLGMYNKGPKPVIDSVKFFFKQNEFKNYPNNSKIAHLQFLKKIQLAEFYLYAEAADSQFNKVFATNGSCKLRMGKKLVNK